MAALELVNDLVLALFPSTADDYDVLDMLSIIWASNEKALKHVRLVVIIFVILFFKLNLILWIFAKKIVE